MTDPRRHPEQALITEETAARVTEPLCDLKRTPNGPRDRQLLYGDGITVLGRSEGHALIRADKDGYCGWLPDNAFGPDRTPSHKVTARGTHAYETASIKSADLTALSFGVQITALSESEDFIETELGHVPKQHLQTADALADDPVRVAEVFLRTPYLWGGNSGLGIDCSGLIQAACLACAIRCPGDSDQQEAELGTHLERDSELRRNDLMFWRGHVALVVDATRLIHANAGHMATVYEPIDDALARIARQGDGAPTSYKRFL